MAQMSQNHICLEWIYILNWVYSLFWEFTTPQTNWTKQKVLIHKKPACGEAEQLCHFQQSDFWCSPAFMLKDR